MKKLTSLLILITLFATSTAYAEEQQWDKKDDVEAALHKRYPSTQFNDVQETSVPGIYQVKMGSSSAFVDQTGRYFFFGRLFDMEKQIDLTPNETQTANTFKFEDWPLKDAIKVKKGNGKRVFAVFTDPDCPYCKQIESTISRMDNYTMYMFLFPIASLHPGATQIATQIWCSKDKAKTFESYVLDGVKPQVNDCENPIDSNIALAEKLGISGTPTLIGKSGVMSAGAMPRQELESWLDAEGK